MDIDSGPIITIGRHSSGKYYSAEIDFTLDSEIDTRTIIGIGFDGETAFVFVVDYNIYYITTEDGDGYNAIVSSVDSPVITDPDGYADGDGIINFDEFILHGTDAYSPDTHGDGVTDSFALSKGLLPAINYSEIVSTARTAGQTDVTGDPATYSLYTSSDVTSAEATSRSAGQNDVTSDPASYTLFTATEVTNNRIAGLVAGQNEVINDPGSYSLYTAGDVTSAEATARTLGQGDIINNPTIHGLFGENTVEDVRIGVPMMRKNSEGKLLFDFQIQASDDLQNWTTLDTSEYEVIPSSDKEFLRVGVSNE